MSMPFERRYLLPALRLVKEAAGETFRGEYKSLVQSFGALVLHSGLAQACGFLLAKGGSHHKRLLAHLVQLLQGTDRADDTQVETWYREMLASTQNEYRMLTRQSLAAVQALKRHAQALIEDEG